jgi:mono/diheme cytochrome c family protein
MPKVSLRADQLSAIGKYLLDSENKHEGPEAAAPPANSKSDAASPRPVPSNRAEMLYQMFCSQCHGIQGNGKGINARYMFVKPRDHTSSAEMGPLTDDRLFAAIKFGGAAVNKSSLMPSWGATLKDADIQLLVEYLRRLSGTAGAE